MSEDHDDLLREVGYTAAFLGFSLASTPGGMEKGGNVSQAIMWAGELANAMEAAAEAAEVNWGVSHSYQQCTRRLVSWILHPTKEGFSEVAKRVLRESEIIGEVPSVV
jgi:hypothetical protein